jgi:hypothetical protein
MLLMKKFSVFIFVFLSLFSDALGDQAAVVTESQAERALAILRKSNEIRHFCAPCGDAEGRTVAVETLHKSTWKGDDKWQVFVNGESIDLAYVYVKDGEVWKNLAILVGIEVTDVPRELQAGDRRFSSDAEEIIKEIRRQYAQVQNELGSYKKLEKKYVTGGGSGLVITYYKDDDIRKMAVRFDGEGASGLKEYFFWDGELFFHFDKWETFQIWEDQENVGVTENRYYFRHGRLIRWLVRSHEDDFKPKEIGSDDDQFILSQDDVLEEAEGWLRFSNSDEEDYDAFLSE